MNIFMPELEVSPTQAHSATRKFEPRAKPRAKARASTSSTQHHPKPSPVSQEPSATPFHKQIVLNAEDSAFPVDSKPLPSHTDSLSLSYPHTDSCSMHYTPHDIDVHVKHADKPLINTDDDDAHITPASIKQGQPSIVQADTVVREIDVYLCPKIDLETKLYLLQYPLRPHWWPYGLEEKCDSVRVKPKLKKLEVDLVVDTDGENYDQDADEFLKRKKQTLSSSKIALTTNYAAGLLRGNKLHLAPLDAIVQLRPSMKYLDEADVKKKSERKSLYDEEMIDAKDEDDEEEKEEKPQLVALKVQVKKQETERQEQLRLQSHAYLKQLDEAEAWIPLETHGVDSPITDRIQHVLTSTNGNEIQFSMPMSEYVGHVVPSRASLNAFEAATQAANPDEDLSRSFLDTLPLEQRFTKLLSKGRAHVLQFERLMKLAPTGCTEEEVLSVLEDMAHLVQGCWVAASSIRYSGKICILRDYILSLFTKNRVIQQEQLKELQVPKEMIREVLLPLAVQRPTEGGWEFQESTDSSFLKRHKAVAKEQMQRWSENEEQIKQAAFSLRNGTSNSNKIFLEHKGSHQLSNDMVANTALRGSPPTNSRKSSRGSRTPVMKENGGFSRRR